MTRKTFYQKIREFAPKFQWTFNSLDRRISASRGILKFCPITAVCYGITGEFYQPSEVWTAAKEIYLSDVDAGYIVDLADNHFDDSVGGQAYARKNLEKMVGL